MVLEIREVWKCPDGEYGTFEEVAAGHYVIEISRSKNRTVAGWGSTALHEVLHLWLELLRHKGFKVHGAKEHSFIFAVEESVLEMAKKHLKKKGS